MKNRAKIITISLGGSIINPGSIDKEFLKAFRDLVLEHYERTKEKFVIICGGGKVARDYIKASPENIPPGQKDLVGILATWVNAQLIASWFQGFTPSKPYSGAGVDKSLPLKREYSRNSRVATMQTVCSPTSSWQVLHLLSRKYPVRASL